MTLYKWSQTASADSTINWAEGQAPSSVNDSARAMMAAIARYRDDIAGAIVTTGTSTVYTVSSYQVFDSLAHLKGQMIAFTPDVTNGATVTLNVDSLGAKPLRTSPGVELLSVTIIQGTPSVAVYNNGDGAFYLRGCSVIPITCRWRRGWIIEPRLRRTPRSHFQSGRPFPERRMPRCLRRLERPMVLATDRPRSICLTRLAGSPRCLMVDRRGYRRLFSEATPRIWARLEASIVRR
jgi:hypothetical protein